MLGRKERAFYEGKVFVAEFFARNILPHAKHTAEILSREDMSAIEIPAAAFASI